MTEYLLAVHVGPVQEFIAAARRTADLWAGSRLLLEVVGAAAKAFPDEDRIFPHDPTKGGANRILAFVRGDPAVALKKAETAARDHLLKSWNRYIAELTPEQTGALDLDRGEAQVRDFLTVMGAWVPITSRTDYQQARERVELLLRSRKVTRDFTPAVGDDAGLAKSPLDPSLPTIRRDGKAPVKTLGERPLFLKKTESLDAISLLKRIKGVTGGDGVLSTRTLAQRAKTPSAVNPTPAEQDSNPAEYAYFAILVADGDHMGQFLNELASQPDGIARHREIGAKLDSFASTAHYLLQKHGQPVYCGGDDVMGFLPVPQAVAVATGLAEAFGKQLGRQTLSAGIAIVHYKEPLSVGLARARRAEQEAKRTRDAVCVTIHPRGGFPRSITRSWKNLRLDRWQLLFAENHIPSRLPYELHKLALEWPTTLPPDALAAEARRIIDRKIERTEDSETVKDEIAKLIEAALGNDDPAADLQTIAEELTMARFLSGTVNDKEVEQ